MSAGRTWPRKDSAIKDASSSSSSSKNWILVSFITLTSKGSSPKLSPSSKLSKQQEVEVRVADEAPFLLEEVAGEILEED